MLDLVTQRHYRLLTFSGLAIAGAVCPIAAVSTVVTGIAGGVVATDAIAHHLSLTLGKATPESG